MNNSKVISRPKPIIAKSFLNKIGELTNDNYHGECLILIAKKFKLIHFIKAFNEILTEHLEVGYLTFELSTKRSDLSEKMFAGLRLTEGNEVVDLIMKQM